MINTKWSMTYQTIATIYTQKEYKIINNWLGKVILWESCKNLKFNHTNKWYIHNPESVLENEMHKPFRDLEIQTDHLILARRPGQVIINEKMLKSGLCWPAEHRVKLKNAKRKINTSTSPGFEKAVEHENDGDINCNRCTWYSHERIGTETEELWNKSIAKIRQNTDENPRYLKRLTVA